MSVVSVQKFSLSLGDNELTESDTLAGGTVAANCIPFVTSRVSARAGAGGDEFRQFCVEAYFSGGTVVVERQEAGTGQSQLQVEVTVVEFDGTDIVVQQGQYSMADTESSDVIDLGASTVTLANTFLYHTWGRGGDLDSNYDVSAVRGRITGTDELTFDRTSGDKPVLGRWYLADATVGGDFTVQAKDIALTTSDTTNTASLTGLTAGTLAKTFLLGSYKTDGQDDANDNTVDLKISATDTITCTRQNSVSTLDWSGFAVTMTDSTAVQRGTLEWATSDASTTVEITTAVTLADSWVHVAGSCGSIGGGSWPDASSVDVLDTFVALDFPDAGPTDATIRFQHDTSGASADQDISWEVIEWDVGAAATPRRVMVRG